MAHSLTTGREAELLVEQLIRAGLIVCDTIRRFKGLERPVIVLVELDPADAKLERLLDVGASRATQHLIVFGPIGRVDSVTVSS